MGSGVGVWTPQKRVELTLSTLRRYVELMRSADPDNIAHAMRDDEVVDQAALMKQEPQAWEVAEALADDEIVLLVRFFTLAEMQLTGWDGGKQSPVISLVRILKSRNAFGPDLRKWIKTTSDNRFLPYGSAL